jgi:LysM repeat protein
MAQSFGATFLGPLEDYDSGMHSGKGDGIHPSGGYKKLLAAGSNVAKADIITPDVVKPNQSSKVSTGDYTVVSGDNLTKIAKAHGVALADLIAANKQIKNPDRIYPGDVISIPSSGSTAIAPKQDVKPDTAPSPAPIKKRSVGKYEIRNVDSASDVFEFFKGKGLNDNQCAAFVGNIYTESRVNTAAHNKNENARGIVQWRMDRLQNLANFAKKLKKKWHSLELQLDFTWHELTGKYRHVLPELEANKNNLGKCVEIIMNKYEVANPKSYPERLGFAESAMSLFGSETDKKSA